MADTSSTNVYLSNLPLKFNEHQLEQLFNPHPIASLKIMYDLHGESRGVGFVRLFDRGIAKECIERLHGRVLPGTTMPLQVRFADSEAQKQLKHSVCQKHTLESLGLLRGAAAFGGMGRVRTASELDAAVARRQYGASPGSVAEAVTPAFPHQMPSLVAPYTSDFAFHGRTGLGIGLELPNQHMFVPHLSSTPVVNNGMWSAMPAPHVMYSGTEGSYPLERPFHLSSIIADGGKAHDSAPVVPFIPPPGLVHPAFSIYGPNTNGNGHEKDIGMRKNQAVRVRFPGDAPPAEGTRSVSDPMTMVAAQSRIREALGLPDRVRKAVSADNSIDEKADITSDGDTEEEDDSISIRC